MLLCRLLGHEQDKKQRDRLPVWRIERNGRHQPDNRTACLFQALDASMRDGNTTPKACRTEFFPRKKTIEYGTARNPLVVLEDKPGMFEDALFAAHIKIENDIFGG